MAALREALRILARASAPRQGEMNALRMFAGPMAKTADHQALARAQEMAGQGATRDAIWRDTGWFQGVDGKWRFEIDDSGTRLSDETVDFFYRGEASGERTPYTNNARDVLPHERLYEAYPDLGGRATRLERGDDPFTSTGSYDPRSGMIQAEAPDTASARSVILHEDQHGVQRQEGFAVGGNTNSPETFQNARAMRDAAQREWDEITAQVRSYQNDQVVARGLDDSPETMRMLVREWERNNSALAARREAAWDLMNAPPARYEAYRRLAGETEARNVQTRRDFTPEERRSRPPWETQDVPDDQQIVRFDGDRASNALGDILRASAGLGGVALAGDITLRELLREQRARRTNPAT